MEAIEPLKQIDSVFCYSPSFDVIPKKKHTYTPYLCENDVMLRDAIRKSRFELYKQTSILSIYNKKEKTIYNLSKEQSSFVFFQLLKHALKNMPKTCEAKETMITICRDYYRGNLTELVSINSFNLTYKSSEAIYHGIQKKHLFTSKLTF
jgi:hypothetical protein